MAESQKSLRAIFDEALEIGGAEQRRAYLDQACGGDVTLRAEVEELLRSEESAGGFLADPKRDASAASAQVTEREGDRIGRYKLLQKIGEGGCGVVYMAEQTEPVRRRVALKIIKLGMDTRSVVARFEAERQALAMMDHTSIARVLDAGATDTGRPFFVMELVRGIKITDYCEQNHLSTPARLQLFIQVCQAVQHAHQKGIIHRDLKPSNILVTSDDGVPLPKVIDFGIAKATADIQLTDKTLFTRFEMFIGTPAYMSPEQAEFNASDIDTRTDIYALGVLLYELLTGQTPFDTDTLLKSGLEAMRKTIRETEPARPSTRLTMELAAAARVERVAPRAPSSGDNTSTGCAHGVTRPTTLSEEEVRASSRRMLRLKETIQQLRGDLDWIILKALEKDRTRRYDTANGLAMDIQRHLSNEPVIARPPSTAYRIQKAWQRNKLAFTAGAAVAAALVVGIGVSTWQAFVAIRARSAAQTAQVLAQAKQQEAEAERQRADAQARNASESQQQSRRLLYAADMNLAQQTLILNNLGRARRLLDRHRPQPGEEDLRGWEWRYLWQLTRSSALVTLSNRPTRGFEVSFSPDGRRLAVGWWDGHVDLWDVPGRRWIRALTDREYSYNGRVAFSPVRNLLAATSEPKVVALYDLDSGRESILWRAPEQGEWWVRDLAFSQDGSKLVIYATASTPELGGAGWVVNVSSAQIESRHAADFSGVNNPHFGAARLSPDNRRLYLARKDSANVRYSIQCLDVAAGKELWQTEPQRDLGLAALALSPDGRVLASGSGHEDPTIRVWDAATGRLLVRLEGHTSWVCKLAFTKDGRRLISAATDQSIRFWDTGTWTETQVLRGHTDEVHGVAISEPAQLIASAGKDGNLMLWRDDRKSAADGYSRLPEKLGRDQVLSLDHSRVLLLPPGKPPELVDLKLDSAPEPLPEIGSSTNVLGCFGTNLLCHWNGTNQILVRELRGAEFTQRGAITLESGTRPTGLAYNAARQLLAWSEEFSATSVYLASLAAPGRRIELKSDARGLVPFRFSEDGNYLAAWTQEWERRDTLRAWNIETGQVVASVNQGFKDAAFARGGRMLVAATAQRSDHEIWFYDLAHADQPPRRVPGKHFSWALAVSPDGGLVASATGGGQVRFFDPIKGELMESVHGHLNAVAGIAFSGDGRRLISTHGGRDAVKLWDVRTRQELLTLGGTGSFLMGVGWSADGDVILAGGPWQAWRAPSWEEIAAAEAKDPPAPGYGGQGKTEIKQP